MKELWISCRSISTLRNYFNIVKKLLSQLELDQLHITFQVQDDPRTAYIEQLALCIGTVDWAVWARSSQVYKGDSIEGYDEQQGYDPAELQIQIDRQVLANNETL